MHNLSRAALAALVLLAVLWGQSGGGRITGRVTDMTGRPMGDVSLRLESGGTTAATTRTAADGTFTLDNVAPGTYSVFLESGGQTWRNPTTLTVASGSAPIDVTFSQGNGTEDRMAEIRVSAQAPTIQTDSSEVSRGYETRTIRSLPLLDRQNQDLISLMPGVSPAVVNQDRVEDPQRRRTFNVNGLPAWANAYYQDGSYQTEMFNNKPIRISPNEGVQQLNIVTSNFNGEHGFAGGSWTNVVTRPGTNGFHGSLFGLYTSSFLTTRNPLNTGTDSPGFNQNQFGGSAGGPIVPNKTFIFAGYEGLLRRGDTLQIASVPTAELRAGDFGGFGSAVIFNPATGSQTGTGRVPFASNRIPLTASSATARAILGFLPPANQPGLVNNLVGNARLLEDLHRFDTKLDHRFSDKSTGFFRYGFTHSSVNRGSILGVLGDPAQAELRNHSATASYTRSFTNHLAGEFRFGYGRYRNEISPWGDFGALNDTLGGLGFAAGLPQLNIAGFGSYGFAGNFPSKPVNNNFDFATNWTVHNGMHNLKLGVQIIRNRADGFDAGPFSPRGSFFYGSGATALPSGVPTQVNMAANSFAGFLTGAPTTAGVSSFLQTPTYRQWLTSGFVTDTINLWQKLYLELGLRYDVYSPIETRTAGGAVLYDPVTNGIQAVGSGGINMFGNVDYDLNNFAPRVGLVFRPVSRLAFRAGYGVHYFPVPYQYSAINQAVLGLQQGIVGGFGTTPFRVPTQPTAMGTVAPNLPLNVGATDPQTPYVQSYSAMVQADMGNGFLVDVGYSGNVGRQMPFSRALNVALPGTGLAGVPFASFNRFAPTNFRSTGLNSNFNSLQVNLTKRFAAGLAFAGAYTFGKALDYGFDQVNPFDTRANYAVSDWDRRHTLSISHLWQLPFGPGSPYLNSGWAGAILGSWELNGILHWATGTPYSVTADPLACACPGLLAQPAAFSGTASSFMGQATFDPALFSVPPAGTFGGLGRNSFRGPELFSYDLSVFRAFPFRESFKFELRAEAYNLTNTTNYMNPVSTLGSPAFGRPTQTFNGAGGRQFQLGGRLLF